MCLAIPGKILSIRGTVAEIDIMGTTVRADLSMVPGTVVGDYVIVHAGFAITKYSRSEAEEALAFFRELAQQEPQP